jgi:hypothetical protein
MAVSRFANAKPSAGINTLLWESDRQALVSVVAVNIGGTTKISAYVDPSDEPPTENIYYIDDVPLKNRDTFETFKLAVNVGDRIYVSSESGDVSFFTNGIYDKNGTTDIHVGIQAPTSPVSIGTIWINESDPDNLRVLYYSGTDQGFVDAGIKGTFEVIDEPPEDPDEGDVWFNSSDGRFYVYYDGFWIEALSNEAGPTGPTGSTGPLGPTGPQGEQGIAGIGVTILGSYSTVEELEAAHPTGSVGDGYLVGGDLYVWDDTNEEWDNVGNIQGPTGPTGPSVTGPTGPSGVISVTGPITNSGTSTSATLGFNETGFAKLNGATFSGTVTTSNGITNAQAKNALIASGYNSASGGFAHASRVVMTAVATGSANPTTRPDGTALVAGDVWISY